MDRYTFVVVADQSHQSVYYLGFEGFGGTLFTLHQNFQQSDRFQQYIGHFLLHQLIHQIFQNAVFGQHMVYSLCEFYKIDHSIVDFALD